MTVGELIKQLQRMDVRYADYPVHMEWKDGEGRLVRMPLKGELWFDRDITGASVLVIRE